MQNQRENSQISLKNLYCILTRSQEFLRAGGLSENKGKNYYFFLAIKLHADIVMGFFPGPAVLL